MRDVARIVDAQAEATSVTITRTLVSLTQVVRDRSVTTQIARILDSTRNRSFRILPSFTTKAGDEMRACVETLLPGLTDRSVIGTFHSFCAQVLRQHGSHLDIKPDFGIYDRIKTAKKC